MLLMVDCSSHQVERGETDTGKSSKVSKQDFDYSGRPSRRRPAENIKQRGCLGNRQTSKELESKEQSQVLKCMEECMEKR